MSTVIKKEQCPKCKEQGKDRSKDNLSVYSDGGRYCHACQYLDNSAKQGYKEPKPVREVKDISMYNSYPVKALTHKRISEEIAKRYGVRSMYNQETGEPDGVLYPYYKDGDLVGYKSRRFPKSFSAVGDVKKAGLFGQQIFNAGGKMLLITEGEDDSLAAAQLLLEKGKNYSVVSIPSGANTEGTIEDRIKLQYEYIASFQTVMLALDNDEPGKATAKGLADWLAPSTKVKIVHFPEDIKDAGDLLEQADGADVFWQCLWNSTEYSPEGILSGDDITLEELIKPLEKGYLTPYTELDNKLKGFRKGELSIFTAGSGIGKSTIAREIAYHFMMEHKLRVANIFLEESHAKTAQGYIALHNNVPLSLFRTDPVKILPLETIRETRKLLVANGRNFFYNHFGSMGNDILLSKMRYYANALNVDFIVLDHLSMVISGQESNNERKDIDMLMTEIAAFCNETGVGVLVIVHLKRGSGSKEKSFNEGGQVSLSDLRGSASLEQLAWNVIALERNQQDREEADFSRIRILKNREWGFLGEADMLHYNTTTGRLLPAQNTYQEDE